MEQQGYRAALTVTVEVEFSGIDPAARAAMLLGVLGRQVAGIRMPGVTFSLTHLVDADIDASAPAAPAAEAEIIEMPAPAAAPLPAPRATRWGPRWSPAAVSAV